MIDQINYYVKTYDILTNQQYIINDINLSLPDSLPYTIDQIDVTNDIFNPVLNTANIRLNYSPLPNSNVILVPAIAGGNVVQIFESTGDNIGNCIFVGYIATVEIDQSGQNSGTSINLTCESILCQLSKQLVINSKEDVATLLGSNAPITNFVFNKVVLGDILKFMTEQSLLSYVANQGIVNTENTDTPYQGVALPFDVIDNAGTGFEINSQVFYFASTEDDRLTSLIRTINAYQMVIFQDLDGSVEIVQPNVDNDNNDYYFNVGNYNKNNDIDSLLYTGFSYINKAADVANRTYASLINVGFNITSENDKNTINYVAEVTGNLFPRSKALLDSGIFEITKHDVVDMTSQMLTDPLLINVLSKSISGGNLVTNDVSGVSIGSTAAGIYANQLLAQELFNETQITITMARGACTTIDPDSLIDQEVLLDIPFGRTIQISDDGALGFNTDVYYVYGFSLSTSPDSGTVLTLRLCKPYTQTCVWTNEAL